MSTAWSSIDASMTIIPAFTHFRADAAGRVTLVASDVGPCMACDRVTFRTYGVPGRLPWRDFEPRDRDGQLREGRIPLSDDAQPGDPDEAECDRGRVRPRPSATEAECDRGRVRPMPSATDVECDRCRVRPMPGRRAGDERRGAREGRVVRLVAAVGGRRLAARGAAQVGKAAVKDGRFRSVAEVARALRLSRARRSQVMRGRWEAVSEQELVITGGSMSAPQTRQVRPISGP